MSTHNIGFYEDLTKIIFQISSNMHLISSSDCVSWHAGSFHLLCKTAPTSTKGNKPGLTYFVYILLTLFIIDGVTVFFFFFLVQEK